jgi:hypothetical protein
LLPLPLRSGLGLFVALVVDGPVAGSTGVFGKLLPLWAGEEDGKIGIEVVDDVDDEDEDEEDAVDEAPPGAFFHGWSNV